MQIAGSNRPVHRMSALHAPRPHRRKRPLSVPGPRRRSESRPRRHRHRASRRRRFRTSRRPRARRRADVHWVSLGQLGQVARHAEGGGRHAGGHGGTGEAHQAVRRHRARPDGDGRPDAAEVAEHRRASSRPSPTCCATTASNCSTRPRSCAPLLARAGVLTTRAPDRRGAGAISRSGTAWPTPSPASTSVRPSP